MSELLTNFGNLSKKDVMVVSPEKLPIKTVNLPLDNTELSMDQAVKLTETIRNASEVLWVLISRAHAGKAWLALGYESWEGYVYAEFDMSRSRSYQILDQGKVIREIQTAVPEGTEIHMTEAAARDLRGILDEVIPQIKEKTEGLEPHQATIVVDQILEEKRNSVIESKQEATTREREEAYNRVDEESDGAFESSQSAHDARDRFENPPVAGNPLANMAPPPVAPVAPRVSDVDVVKIRKNVNAAHDIYSSLSALSSLPEELEEVVAIISPERYAQIDTHLDKAKANLLRFDELWKARKEESSKEEL